MSILFRLGQLRDKGRPTRKVARKLNAEVKLSAGAKSQLES